MNLHSTLRIQAQIGPTPFSSKTAGHFPDKETDPEELLNLFKAFTQEHVESKTRPVTYENYELALHALEKLIRRAKKIMKSTWHLDWTTERLSQAWNFLELAHEYGEEKNNLNKAMMLIDKGFHALHQTMQLHYDASDPTDADIHAGGAGSGCNGPNCGRPQTGAQALHSALVKAMANLQNFQPPPPPKGMDIRRWNDRKMAEHFHKSEAILERFIGHARRELTREGLHRDTTKELINRAEDQLMKARNNVFKSPGIALGDLRSGFHELSKALTIRGVNKNEKPGDKQDKLFGAYGDSGWQYGGRKMPIGYLSPKSLAGFPTAKRSGMGGPNPIPKVTGPKMPHIPNKSMGRTGMPSAGHFKTSPSIRRVHGEKGEKMEGNMARNYPSKVPGDWFKEKPMKAEGPGIGNAHMDPLNTFHPPSLKNPDRVPTDDPGEKNNRFLDVTKRNAKDTEEQRMKRLKRSTPGGNPPLIPVRTTAVAPHSGVYNPMSASAKTRVISRPVKIHGQARQRTSYAQRRSI